MKKFLPILLLLFSALHAVGQAQHQVPTLDYLNQNFMRNGVAVNCGAGLTCTPVPGMTSDGSNGVNVTGRVSATTVNSSVNGVLNAGAAPYSVVFDALSVSDGAMSSGSTTLTSASGKFTAAAVGKLISVQFAGGTSGANQPLVTTIAAYVSTTQVTLSSPALQGVSSAGVIWGTDNTAKYNAWASDICSTGKSGFIPNGQSIYNVSQGSNTMAVCSNTTIRMDRSGTLFVVGYGFSASSKGTLFSISGSNIVFDGLHISGEYINSANRIGVVGQGFGSFIIVPSAAASNVWVTNGLFTNLCAMIMNDYANTDSNIAFEYNTVQNVVEEPININSANSSVSHNIFINSYGIEDSGAQSTYNFNKFINTFGTYVIQLGGNTAGSPYIGSEATHNIIINPASGTSGISIGDAFSQGVVSDNNIQGLSGAAFGITNSYTGYVHNDYNHIDRNTITGTYSSSCIYLSGVTGTTLRGNNASGAATNCFTLSAATAVDSSGNRWSGGTHDISNQASTLRTQDYLAGSGLREAFGVGAAFSNDSSFSTSSGIEFNVAPTGFATTSYVNTAVAAYLPLAGGSTMGGLTTFSSSTPLRFSNGHQWNILASSTQFAIGDGTSGNTPFAINYSGTPNADIITIPAPVINGTATSTNTDERGKLTLVSGTASYTFHQGPGTAGVWTTAPVCQIQDDTNFSHFVNTSTFTETTSTLTIGNATNTTDTYSYICKFGN